MSLNHRNTEAIDLSSGGAICLRLDDVGTSGWTVLEATDHEDLMLTRFVPMASPAMALVALRRANLCGAQRVPVSVGMHAGTLVVSMRLERAIATANSLDQARAELLRFAAVCG